jgi:5-methylcytosine-specific restriction endonuclease McrA
MNCKYLRKRQKNYKAYIYCNLFKKEIKFSDCSNCSDKEYKKSKPINKIGKHRYTVSKTTYNTVLERDKCCRLCGSFRNLELHHIKGRGRYLTDDVNNCIMLCRHCHHNVVHKNMNKYRVIFRKMIEEMKNK